ncbi:unnamed protein product [Larinioides sclopetarius]|uniref:Uncharacterized protein n=1 Tax=Larinioides sclopetarius TaxID=280406 RepID=A0AAV2BAA0_9ARAC
MKNLAWYNGLCSFSIFLHSCSLYVFHTVQRLLYIR